jgi:chromate transport protein ChrA
MELDVSGILLGGFQAVILVVFLVQTIIEVVPSLRGRFTPLVALVVGMVVAMVAEIAPSAAQETLGTGLALAAAASLTVRYVKRGDHEEPAPPKAPTASFGVIEFPPLDDPRN